VPASGEAGHDSILLVRCVDAPVAEIPQEFWVISGCGTRDLAEKIAFIFRRPLTDSNRRPPSLPSSKEAGTAGTAGKPRARKPRKRKETAEDE
jgi:hypothetical protein